MYCLLKKNVEFAESRIEHHGRAPTDAQIGSSMVQETSKEVKDDKLLALREVLLKSMEEEADKEKQASDNIMFNIFWSNNDEESNEVLRLAPADTPLGLAMEEKYAKLRKRQKGRLLSKNAGKGPLSSSRFAPKQRYDPEISKRKGVNAPSSSSLMSLKGKGIAVPNAALPKVAQNNVSASSSFLQSNTSLFNKNVKPTPPLFRRKPAGFLKRNTKPNDWSELELDALWVGVRRYGQNNWEKILTDPTGFIFKNKTPQDLSTRWNIELLKIHKPCPQQPISSSIFPTISSSLRHGSSLLAPNNNINGSSSSLRTNPNQGPLLNLPKTPVIGNLFSARPEFPSWIKNNKNNPIVIDSDSDDEQDRSETTLSA
ncbi:hypothetical protein K1719_031108 [Acacia pycnantha]|nr:hypothetical protein K1719_031108 [Acacia pycnantha]